MEARARAISKIEGFPLVKTATIALKRENLERSRDNSRPMNLLQSV